MAFELLLIAVVCFIVRFVAALFGGGGLVMIPFLTTMGLTPSEAIATNRFASQSGNFSIIKFHQEGQMRWSLAFFFLVPAVIGSVLGAFVVIYIDQNLYEKILGISLLLTLPFFFMKKSVGLEEIQLTPKKKWIGFFLSIGAGFLGGTVAATGIWFTFLFLFAGLTMIQAAGTKKVIGVAMGLVTSVIFAFAGLIDWYVGLVMFASGLFGGWYGAHYGIKAGNEWVKYIFSFFIVLGALKMLFF